MSEVLYRKYRPQNFDQVVGQDHVVSVLKKQAGTKAPSHAYLFVGGRGLGKTSLARIFARELNIAPEDTYEIDAASYRKLEHAKDLKDTVYTLPISSDYKMYIIDEAHMLTKEAWNSLLKTIEEPPKHVIFIFATTEKHKVLPTIISRCVVLDFKNPSIKDIETLVNGVASQESMTLETEEVTRIVHQAKGSFRDALSVLERRLHMKDGFTMIDGHDVQNFLRSYTNPVAALSIIEKVPLESFDYFTELLLETVQYILLSRYDAGREHQTSISLSEEHKQEFIQQKNINSQLLVSLIQLAESLQSTQYKREHMIAWVLNQQGVEN
ncbi:MAG TPA: AAA family ATPase [Candidatus Paceibacterota bacterium]